MTFFLLLKSVLLFVSVFVILFLLGAGILAIIFYESDFDREQRRYWHSTYYGILPIMVFYLLKRDENTKREQGG